MLASYITCHLPPLFLRHADPATSVSLPADYLPQVKRVHSEGGFGSQGYGYDWKLEEAQKNLLRTHTTAVSARMLRQLAQQKVRPRPVRGLREGWGVN